MGTTQVIEVSLIDEPRSDANRTFNKEFCGKLANSIRVEGLHQPIGVRPHPEKEGRYLLVYGRHRFRAIRDTLEWERVECRVLADMDDDDAEMAMLSENLWRHPLTAAQGAAVLKRWWAIYRAKHADRTLDSQGGRSARARIAAERRWQKPSEDGPSMLGTTGDPSINRGEPEAEKKGDRSDDPVPTFAKKIAELTGDSPTNAKRKAKVAKTFTHEQLEALGMARVGAKALYEIAAKVPKEAISLAVNLVASGMDPEEAIAVATEPPGQPAPDPAAKEAAKAEADLPDEEWLKLYCGDLLARLPNLSTYRRDALLYRRIRDPRQALKSAKGVKTAMEEAKVGGGFFYRMVSRFLNLSHPRDWIMCGKCKGQGMAPKLCPECQNDGYKVRSEN